MRFNPAQRRYNRRILMLSVIYAAILLPIVFLFRTHHPSGPLAYVLAVLPALPVIGMFIALGRYLTEETDEYLRLLITRQALIATGLTLSVAMAWGFLESFGLGARIDAYWFVIVWFAGLGLGKLVNKLIERRAA